MISISSGITVAPKAVGRVATPPPAYTAATGTAGADAGPLAWVSGRPSQEKTASTGEVTVTGTSTTTAQMKVSLKAGGTYNFAAAWAGAANGKYTLGMTLKDASGKVVKSASGTSLALTRDESLKLGNGDFTVSLSMTPAKGKVAYLTSYTLYATQNMSKLPAKSGNADMDAILAGGSSWWHEEGAVATATATPVTDTVKQLAGAKTTLRYGFLGGSESYLTQNDKTGFAAMNAGQKTAVVTALQYLSSLVNVQFVEDAAHADMAFGTNEQTASAGYSGYPQGNGSNPTVLMLDNTDGTKAVNTAAELQDSSSYAWYTLVHELGHAMGLKHPGSYNAGGGTTPGPYLSSAKDNRGTTVMSYKDAAGTTALSLNGTDVNYSYGTSAISPSTYKVLDIAALQYMYGANTATTAADVTVSDSDTRYAAVWAPKGVKVDASSTSRTNVFDLRAGYYSSVSVRTSADQAAVFKAQFKAKGVSDARAQAYGDQLANGTPSLKGKLFDGKNTLGLAWGSTYAEIKGGSANDRFYASTYSSTVDGGAGQDTLYLQGSAKLWTQAAGNGGATTYTHKTTGAVITARGFEAVAYYSATAAAV